MKKSQHLPIWHVHNTLLRHFDLGQLGDQTDLVSKLAIGDHQGMLGQHPVL